MSMVAPFLEVALLKKTCMRTSGEERSVGCNI